MRGERNEVHPHERASRSGANNDVRRTRIAGSAWARGIEAGPRTAVMDGAHRIPEEHWGEAVKGGSGGGESQAGGGGERREGSIDTDGDGVEEATAGGGRCTRSGELGWRATDAFRRERLEAIKRRDRHRGCGFVEEDDHRRRTRGTKTEPGRVPRAPSKPRWRRHAGESKRMTWRCKCGRAIEGGSPTCRRGLAPRRGCPL